MVLRILIGAACVAVIGFVAFFAYERISGAYGARSAEAVAECDQHRADLAAAESGARTSTGEGAAVLRIEVQSCEERGL